MDTEKGAGRPALARLAIRKGPNAGVELPLAEPVAMVGRSAESDLPIDDDSVSTRHARIDYERGGWRITDLSSANGTLVDGVKLVPNVPAPLGDGSTVRFGGVETRFASVADADPEAARATTTMPAAGNRRAGVRIPLWVVLVLVLLVAVVWFGLVWKPEPGTPPVPETVDLGAVIGSPVRAAAV